MTEWTGHSIKSIPQFRGQWVNGEWTVVGTQYLQKIADVEIPHKDTMSVIGQSITVKPVIL